MARLEPAFSKGKIKPPNFSTLVTTQLIKKFRRGRTGNVGVSLGDKDLVDWNKSVGGSEAN